MKNKENLTRKREGETKIIGKGVKLARGWMGVTASLKRNLT